ncbi:MAG: chemotaxis response regulator protein-glutamate methylesterase [Phycisphaerae bacterium]
MPNTRTIRVLIVDDSVFMRAMLRDALSSQKEIEIIGTAQNGDDGLQKILCQKPDVVTLDIEMPGLSGLEVLERLKDQKTPCVVVSTKTQAGAQITLEALKRGAVDYVPKPLGEKGATLEGFRERVVQAVLAAAASNRSNLRPLHAVPKTKAQDLPTDAIIAIGISAGGPASLHQMLPSVPANFPPILITQHMPAGFTAAFADRLNKECQIAVKEAANHDELLPGRALIAPGDLHLRVVERGTKLAATLSNGPKVSGFRPSVDALFDSLAQTAPERTVAIVMTGMGCDGSAGIKMLKQRGAYTIAQDEETSVVYGMPKAAADTGCIDRVAALQDIPEAIVEGVKALLAKANEE